MNNLHCKLASITRMCRLQRLPQRACMSTLQFRDDSGERNLLLRNQGCSRRRGGMIKHAAGLYNHQVRYLQLDEVPSYVNVRVTPLQKPGKGELCYVGKLAPSVKLLKLFSIGSSAIVFMMMPSLLQEYQDVSLMAKVAGGAAIGTFAFLSPLYIHWALKRYVTWMYYNEETNTFTATTFNFLAREKERTVKPEDVEHFHGPFSLIKIRGEPLLIDKTNFFEEEMYRKFMRYDTDEFAIPDEVLEELADGLDEEEKEESSAKDDEIKEEKAKNIKQTGDDEISEEKKTQTKDEVKKMKP